jgi:signal transduction histidine kinase
MLPLISVINLIAKSGKNVSQFLKTLPSRFTHADRKKEFPAAMGKAIVNLLTPKDPDDAREFVIIKKRIEKAFLSGDGFGKVKDISKGGSSFEYITNIDLKDSNPKEIDIFLTGDSNKLKQAFYNILKNAVDYSKPAGQVQLRVLKQAKTVQIEITDEGTGIPAEEIAFVFERFYRSSNNSGLYNDGSGLGLAITKEIINKHKGDIKIQSSPGNWTKVTINLPY